LKNRTFIYIQFFLRNIPGGLGQRIRAFFYSKFFGSFGNNIRIDIGVIFDNPINIFLENDIWIMPYSHLTAAPYNYNPEKSIKPVYIRKKSDFIGKIIIGNQTSIGEYNILQGYGGIKIGNRCTTSARCAIYSMSHSVFIKENLNTKTFANSMVKDYQAVPSIMNSIELGYGAWIGYNSVIFSGTIGEFSFIKSGLTINKNIPNNVIYDGLNTTKRFEL
jgi:acetyltransferase-like isoleucine patch superfamily enzyme